MSFAFDYNTQRNHLIIPEYGRLVQRMVEECVQEEDREKRTRMARAVVQAIGKLNPQLRNNENSDRTFWDHLHVMAGFALDVDSPYPVPTAEGLKSKPVPVPYPKTTIRFGHYGKLVERMIPEPSREKKLAALEQGLQLASSLGITSIQTAGGDAATMSLFEEAERQRKLTARLNVTLTVPPAATDGSIDDLFALKQN